MKKEEKQLFFELCKFKNINPGSIDALISKGAATPSVLGHLFYNRMAGVAYGVLMNVRSSDRTNREFRNSLKNYFLQSKQKNESFFKCIEYLSEILEDSKGKYALLKGAYLCGWYPEGCRTSNDADVLTEAKDITHISETLKKEGFKQGSLKSGVFIPADRQEIIASKMMRGETVPYIKEVNLPYMKYFEVDINHSLSYKNENNNIVGMLISNAKETVSSGLKITTLDKYDFILHLCEHLYKEATTYPWVKMKRDMALYKFCDIYALLSDYSRGDYNKLEKRARQLEMKNACYYAAAITKSLFSMEDINLASFLQKITPEVRDVLNIVVSPQDKKVYQYADEDVIKRFFADDRTKLLKEVINSGKAQNA